MSDFIAEARVIVRPDTTKFAAELQAQLAAITAKPVVIPVTAAVAGSVAGASAATQQVAASQQAAAAASQTLGAAQQNLIRTTTTLTSADNALIAASKALAVSQETVVGASSAVAAAQVQLTRSASAVTAAERALAVAQKQGNAGAFLAAERAIFLAEARETEAAAALRAARAEEVAAGRLTAVNKAAFASSASFLGLRGAVLTAGTAFLAATAGIHILRDSLNEAIDAEDTFRRATFLLGDQLASQLADQAKGISQAFAIDDDDVLKFETQVGKILISVGLTTNQTAKLSEGIVKLAADLAAFNRVPVEDTLKAIQGGLAGNARSLKRLGVITDEQTVKQIALARSGKQNASELTAQEIVLARYALITQRAAFQVGAFADQSDTLTAQSQRLSVNLKELEETIGRGLVPVLGGFVKGLNDTFTALNKAAAAAQNLASKIPLIGDSVAGVNLGGFVSDVTSTYTKMVLLGPVFGPVSLAMNLFGHETEDTTKKLTIFDKIAGAVTTSLGGLAAALEKVAAAAPSAAQQASLALAVSRATGDQDEELSLLKEQEARQAAFLDSLLKKPALTQKAIALQIKAAENLARTRAQIKAIEDERAADAKAAAAAAQRAAAALKAAAAAAQREFLARQELTRSQAQNRIAAAALTPGLADDIRRQQQFSALIRAQIVAINRSTLDEKAKAAAVAALTAAALASDKATADLLQQQKDRQASLRDAATNVLLQRVRLAELRLGPQGQGRDALLAALNAAIADAIKRVKAAKTLADRLTEQIALQELINQKNAVLADTVQKGNQAAEFFFSQLQAQAGFVSNLLGNLIPSGQTSGLVGQTEQATAAAAAAARTSGDFGHVDIGLGATAGAQAGRAATSPTAGQASTTNEILRRILHQLQILTRTTEAPEAIFQEKMGTAIMSGGGGNTDVM